MSEQVDLQPNGVRIKKLTVRVEAEKYAELKAIVAIKETSIQAVVSEYLNKYLEENR